MPSFRSTMQQFGNNTRIEVPEEVIVALGGGKKPKVNVTVNGFAYRSSVAVMGGKYLISFASDKRAASGIKGGDAIEVVLELDTAPRAVELPEDLAAALAAQANLRARFEKLSFSSQQRHALSVTDAKTPETRLKRIGKVIDALAASD